MFDTSAWYGFLRGDRISKKVAAILGDPAATILTSGITILEMASLLSRHGRAEKVAPALRTIRSGSRVLPLTESTLEEAGRIHAAERSFDRGVSLADAVILAQAKREKAKVVTADRRLRTNRIGVQVLLP